MNNQGRKISVTDNIQIQKHGSGCCITIIDKKTGKTADITEATLEVIVRNNQIDTLVTHKDYRVNDAIIEHLVRDYNEYEKRQKEQQELFNRYDEQCKKEREYEAQQKGKQS